MKKSFWDFKAYEEKEWFKMLVILLIVLTALYTGLHLFTSNRIISRAGFEYSKLDKSQMEQITRICFDTSSTKTAIGRVKPAKDSLQNKAGKDSLRNKTGKDSLHNKAANDSLQDKKTKDQATDSPPKRVPSAARSAENLVTGSAKTDSCQCGENTICGKLIIYLRNQFNDKIDSVQLRLIQSYLCYCTSLEATGFLSNIRLQVKSYFWLTGPAVYFEIIFWAWFGVICSLLFNIGLISKNRTTDPTDPTTYFDSSEIPSQVSKLLYAPACTLVIVLGYNFFNDQNIVDISSSKGVIVFAFIGGFYSSRLVAFLDRLKEILLPVGSNAGVKGDITPLKNIVVQLQLDASVAPLWDSLKSDLHAIKLTLQKENSTQQAIALNIDKNQWPLFIFDYVKPGTYIIQSLWTTTQNDQVINLKAEQKVEMKDADQSVTLKLTRV